MKVFGHGTTTGVGAAINTRASFVELASLDVDGVELDVRRSADDQLVVIHDDRYPDGRLVVETPAADRPADVILLAEALDLCASLEVNIELKNLPSEETYDPDQRIAELCVDVLEQRGATDRVIVSCFGLGCIDRVVELRPGTPTALLLLSRRPPAEVLLADVHERHRAVHPYVSMVDEAFMRRARELGLRVNAWSVGQESADEVRALIGLGVDGLITESHQQGIHLRDAARPDTTPEHDAPAEQARSAASIAARRFERPLEPVRAPPNTHTPLRRVSVEAKRRQRTRQASRPDTSPQPDAPAEQARSAAQRASQLGGSSGRSNPCEPDQTPARSRSISSAGRGRPNR